MNSFMMYAIKFHVIYSIFIHSPLYLSTNIALVLNAGLCDPGHYCPVNSFLAKQIKCPAGRYGAYPGIANSLCSEECPTGHYCPPGSVLPTQCPGGMSYCYCISISHSVVVLYYMCMHVFLCRNLW